MNILVKAVVVAGVVLGTGVIGWQGASDSSKQADEILKRVHKLDMLNQVLPVLMTKDQLQKILPVIEKARAKVKATEKSEFEALSKLNPKIDSALKEAFEKKKVPGREVLGEVAGLFKTFELRRIVIGNENTDSVIKVLKETLNEGQLASMRNALEPGLYDPGLDPKKMTDDEKLKFYVQGILLDPAMYEILTELYKKT